MMKFPFSVFIFCDRAQIDVEQAAVSSPWHAAFITDRSADHVLLHLLMFKYPCKYVNMY